MPSLVPAAASAIVRMQRQTPPLPLPVFVHIGLFCLGLRALARAHFVTTLWLSPKRCFPERACGTFAAWCQVF